MRFRLLILSMLLSSCSNFSGPPSYSGGGGSYKGIGAARPAPAITEAEGPQEPEMSFESESAYSSIPEDQKKKLTKPTPTPRTKEAFRLDWPVDEARLTQKFHPKIKRKRRHQGIDLAASRGTPIYAAHQGLVIYVGHSFRGYGNMVLVEYDDQWASLYAHLEKIYVQEGQWLERGELLGTMGRTGRSTGVHLHFELIQNKIPIDPQTVLPN